MMTVESVTAILIIPTQNYETMLRWKESSGGVPEGSAIYLILVNIFHQGFVSGSRRPADYI